MDISSINSKETSVINALKGTDLTDAQILKQVDNIFLLDSLYSVLKNLEQKSLVNSYFNTL